MSKNIPILLAFQFLAMASFPAFGQAPRTIKGGFDYDKARQTITQINRMRNNRGLKPLKMDAALTEAAMLRAAEIAFRAEEDENDEIPFEHAKRPNGEGNLKLIGEQRHLSQPKVDYYYLRLSGNHFSKISLVVSALEEKSRGKEAFYSTSMRFIGCGSFISAQGLHYWVLFLMPDNGSEGEIPKGQCTVEVGIATNKGEQTRVLSRTVSETDLTPTSFEVSGRFNYSKAIEVVEITNKERKAKGLKPYIMDSTLMELAMIRAAEMKSINKMTHTRPNGESGLDIIEETWTLTISSGENIAYGQSSAQQVMSQWMNSPGHRSNIMNAYLNRMGAGECDGYWVQLFAKSSLNTPVLSKSAGRIDEVTVEVTLVEGKASKVVKRKRGSRQ
jgi:uncharacterized protein YkwD